MKIRGIFKNEMILILPIFLLVLFIGIIPFLSAFYNGFFHDTWGDKYFVGFQNYISVAEDMGLKLSLKISLVYTLLCSSITLLISIFISYTLNQKGKVSSLVYIALLVPWGIPSYILVPVWRAILHGGNGLSLFSRLFGMELNLLINPGHSFISAVFVSVWLVLPATSFVLLSAMRKINNSVLEAAKIEGANRYDILFRIIIPQIKSSIITISILNFIKFFKEFTVIFLLTSGGAPLLDGITPTQVIGATTNAEIYIYGKFSLGDNFGLTSAYAGTMGLIICLLLGVFFVYKNNKNKKIFENGLFLFFLIFVYILLGNGMERYIFAVFYFSLFTLHRKLKTKIVFTFKIACMSDIIIMLFNIMQNGLLKGLNTATLIVLVFFVFMSLETRKKRFGLFFSFKDLLFKILININSTMMIFLSATIIFILIYMSISPYSTTYVRSFIPDEITFLNFKTLFETEEIWKYFLNSFRYSLPVSVLTPFLCLPAAFYLTGKKNKVTDFLLAALSFTGVFGGMHTLIPLFVMFQQISITDSTLPLVLIYIFQSVPFSLFTIKSYLDSIPVSLYEYARLEGMNKPCYVLKIIFPLSLPAIIISSMISFLSSWNGFLAPLVFIDSQDFYPVSLKINSYVGSIASGNPKWNLFAALSLLNMIIISILFIAIKKPFKFTELSNYDD